MNLNISSNILYTGNNAVFHKIFIFYENLHFFNLRNNMCSYQFSTSMAAQNLAMVSCFPIFFSMTKKFTFLLRWRLNALLLYHDYIMQF